MNPYNIFLENFLGYQKTKKYDLTQMWLENGKLCASNGHVLCCIDAALCDIPKQNPLFPDTKAIYATAKMLDEPIQWNAADLYPTKSELKSLTPTRQECSACDDGEVTCEYDHKHDCPDCDGLAFVEKPEIYSVKFNKTYFQWRYFKLVLEAADKFGNGEFQQLTEGGESQQLFQIDGIEIFVMPQRDDVVSFVPLRKSLPQAA